MQASEVLSVSHDTVNRFLLSGNYTGRDLFDCIQADINLTGGVLSIDDTVLDKPYTQKGSTALVGHFWSGKHKRAVQGINLIVLVYTPPGSSQGYPVDFRLYDKTARKTKNDYFLEMLEEVLVWGLRPAWVTADAWYSSTENLRRIKKYGLSFIVGFPANRMVFPSKEEELPVSSLTIPEKGTMVYVKQFGYLRLIKKPCKEERFKYYAVYQANADPQAPVWQDRDEWEDLMKQHWHIEQFFRLMKQCCQIEKFYVRSTKAIESHIFSAMAAFYKLVELQMNQKIPSLYACKKTIFLEAQQNFIRNNSYA